jgi:hypothetical protein
MTYIYFSIYLANNKEVFSIDDSVVDFLPNGSAHLDFVGVK